MRGSVTRTWLAMCAVLYAAGGTACSSSSPNLPPIEASGNPGASCAVGNSCRGDGSYCVASGQACKYLECVGGTWQCPSDASVVFDAGVDAMDAASGGADAADGADGADGASTSDAADAAAESGKGDASSD